MTTLTPEKQSAVLEKLMATGYVAHNLASRLSTLFSNGERRPAPKVDALAQAKAAFPGIKIPDPKEGPPSPLGSPAAPPATTEAAAG